MNAIKIIKNTYVKCGFVFMGLLCPMLTFAAETQQYFTMAKNDVSVEMLKSLFGNVGGVLPGMPGLFNVMFREFNNAILILASFLVIYTITISVVNTAKQGEFLGGKLDSMWLPIRMVVGVSCVVPGPTGYSIIQIVMMKIVLLGVGAADQLWGATVLYFKDHTLFNTPTQTTTTPSNTAAPSGFAITKQVLTNLSCMHWIFKQNHGFGPGDITKDTLAPKLVVTADTATYTFSPASPNSTGVSALTLTDTNDCGSLSFPLVSTSGGLSENVINAYKSGFGTVMDRLNVTAKEFVYRDPGTIKGDVFAQNYAGEFNPIYVTTSTLLSEVALAQDQDKKPNGDEPQGWDQKFIDDVTNNGWANAGLYYFAMASQLASAAKPVALDGVTLTAENTPVDELLGFVNALNTDAMAHMWNTFISGYIPSPAGTNPVSSISAFLTGILNSILTGGDATITNMSLHPIIRIAMMGNWMCTVVSTIVGIVVALVLVAPLSAVLGTAGGLASGPFALINPLVWLSALGPISQLLVGFAVGLFAIAMPGTAATMAVILVAIAVGLAALYVAGLTMSVYVPLIPFIIFVFAVIGWMIAVVETMLAAPMVAIGLAYPEGQHEVLGRAEPAIQLLANVFLRPSLMIFGLVAGILVSFVAINFLTTLFGTMTTILGSSVGLVGLGPVQSALLIVIYVSFVIAILNRSFALIHIFPDKILSWIGWQAQFGEYAKDAERDVHGAFGKAAGMAEAPVKDVLSKPGEAAAAEGKELAKKAVSTAAGAASGGVTGGFS